MTKERQKNASFKKLVKRVKGWRVMDLPELLAAIDDDEAVSELLTHGNKKLKPRTVAAWRLKQRSPNITHAAQLSALSDGVLTANKIFGPAMRALSDV